MSHESDQFEIMVTKAAAYQAASDRSRIGYKEREARQAWLRNNEPDCSYVTGTREAYKPQAGSSGGWVIALVLFLLGMGAVIMLFALLAGAPELARLIGQ